MRSYDGSVSACLPDAVGIAHGRGFDGLVSGRKQDYVAHAMMISLRMDPGKGQADRSADRAGIAGATGCTRNQRIVRDAGGRRWRHRSPDRRVDRPATARSLPWETAPRYLLRDRDRIFGADFVKQVKAMGIKHRCSRRPGRRGSEPMSSG